LPRGRLSEIAGSPSSGATSLLVALLAQATARAREDGGLVALVDAADAFDPTGAAASGADLEALLWVRGGGQVDAACRAAGLLARCPGFTLVALDLGEALDRRALPHATWIRLQRAVESTDAVLLLHAPRSLAGSSAAVALTATRLGTSWSAGGVRARAGAAGAGAARVTRLDGLRAQIAVRRGLRDLRHPGAQWSTTWYL
jgi:RecA/RadA recombinase